MDEKFYTELKYINFRKCTPGWRMYEHQHDFCDITYIIQGSAVYTINGIEHKLTVGDLLCLPPGTVRKAITYPDKLMHCFSVDFRLKKVRGGEISLPLPIVNHIGYQNDIIVHFHELFSIWVDRQPGYLIKAVGIFFLILHRLLELTIYKTDTMVGDYRVKKIILYISKHYSEKITVRKMADMVGLDISYLGVLFKRATGDTLNHFLVKTRIKNAQNILQTDQYSIIEVAGLCGYDDFSYFSKQFKAIVGVSPSKYFPKKM